MKEASRSDIASVGKNVFTALYGGGSKEKSLDHLRFHLFSRASVKIRSDLASLPPTESAAEQHSFRTFHQVQTWMGNNLDPARVEHNAVQPAGVEKQD